MRVKLKVSIVEQLFFWIFILPFLIFSFLLIYKPGNVESAELGGVYFYANTKLINVSSGLNIILAFEPTQSFSAGSTLTISFQEDEDGYWCRTPGALSVVGKTSAIPDRTGTAWNIDAGLTGTLSANCTQGSGPGSSDTITISGVGPLSPGVTYGVQVYGSSGALGTHTMPYGHRVDILLSNGAGPQTDDYWFLFSLTNANSVTIVATIEYIPECDDNFDCNYPLEICDANQQCRPCISDPECSYEDLCVLGQCNEDPACTSNNDCAFPNEICPTSLICRPCQTHAECGTGYTCNSGTCNIIPPPECTRNSECNYPNRICNTSQKCVACTSTAQCNAGDECQSGVCVTPPPIECTTNAQCNYPNEICDQVNMCNPCITDWQCNYGEVCVAGVCTVRFQCADNDDCRYPDEICDLNNDCSPCEYDSQCGAGSLCVDGTCEAIPPSECANNEQCDYPDLVCVDEYCIDCVVNSECNEGDICIQGDCAPEPPMECTNNAHCDYPNETCDDNNLCNPCLDDFDCDYSYECKTGLCVYEEPPNVDPVSGDNDPSDDSWVEQTFDNILIEVGLDPIQVSKTVQEVENVAPVATTASLVTTTFVGLSLLNVSFLEGPVIIMRGFLGLLTILGIRTKGQPYGYVYNAITKEPLSNALVRIFEHSNGKKRLLRTSVTNAFGVFDSELDPGEYSIYVSKNGYGFPSQIVQALSDYPIDNIYKGSVFRTDKEVQIYYSIPIDPVEDNFFIILKAVLRERFAFLAKFIQLSLLIFGAGFSLILFLTIPVFTNLLIFLIYIPSIAFTALAFSYKDPREGTVVDQDKKIVPGVTLGLFDEKEERYVTKRVSDEEGHFRFVVDRGFYALHVLDQAYEAVEIRKEEIDSKKNKGMSIIVADVVVRKKELAADDPSLASNIDKKNKEKDAAKEKETKETPPSESDSTGSDTSGGTTTPPSGSETAPSRGTLDSGASLSSEQDNSPGLQGQPSGEMIPPEQMSTNAATAQSVSPDQIPDQISEGGKLGDIEPYSQQTTNNQPERPHEDQPVSANPAPEQPPQAPAETLIEEPDSVKQGDDKKEPELEDLSQTGQF